MISSTRSSESASRSSWNDASSVISFSSMPSCSVKTSLTRSKTSSREAAMSPHLSVDERADSTIGKPFCKPVHDLVLHSAGGEADGVRDGGPRGVAVRDHRQATQAKQVGAAVGVRVEALPQPVRRRPDEKAAEFAARRRNDLLPERVEDRLDRPLEELQADVAGEAVRD